MPFDSCSVLGVRVDDADDSEVLKFIDDSIAAGGAVQIVTVNVEYVMRARRHPEFAGILAGADLATADGAGVLWAARRRGAHVARRVGGSDLIWPICDRAAAQGHRVFFLGGAPGVASAAASTMQSRYPGLAVAGACAGSPSEQEQAPIVDLIRQSEAHILLVAFGAPAQDIWIARNLRATGASVGIGVGGTFDYVAGVTRRAPVWMQEHGLEWLWRLMRQPWRWRRMMAIPQFIALIVLDEVLRRAREDT